MASVSDEIAKILQNYTEDVSKAIENAGKDAAEKTKRKLKATAPKSAKGSGSYANSFAVKKEGHGRWATYIVYSKKPGLAHLLEHGHAIANQYGRTGGRVNGTNHWAQAEHEGNLEFENDIRNELGG